MIHNNNFQNKICHWLRRRNPTIKGCFERPVRLSWGRCRLSSQLHRLRQPVTPLTTDCFKVSEPQSVKSISRFLTTDCFRVSWEVRLLYLGLSPLQAMTEAEAPPSPGAEVGHHKHFHCPFRLIWQHFDWLISIVNIFCYIEVEQHWIIGVCAPGCSDCPSGCCKGGRGGGLHKQSFDFDLKNKSAQVRIGAATSLACIAGDNPTISCHNIIRGILP